MPNTPVDSTQHIPVLLKQLVLVIDPKKDDVILDCTCGLGGHGEAFLERIGKNGTYIGIDQDQSALSKCQNRLKTKFPKHKIVLLHDNFSNISNLLEKIDSPKVDHVIADLGVSSLQLDTSDRGFSHRYNGPLDMRMDQRNDFTASRYINACNEKDLFETLVRYGEIPSSSARKICKTICAYRESKKIETTNELKDIVLSANPNNFQSRKNLLAPVFQAVRIKVNNELENIEIFLEDIFKYLKPEAKIGIISFHSLEDRIVKRFFKHWSKSCVCDKKQPICTCKEEYPKRLKLITKQIITPSQTEIKTNKRARSAKLRIAKVIEIR